MRMSASSSTTRMSCAMENLLSLDGHGRRALRLFARTSRWENQCHAGPPAFPVFQNQLSPVLLHDLLHDGETEPRALGTRGHVRLRQALASFLGQAAAVVLDRERHLPLALHEPHPDVPRLGLAIPALDRLDGVLEEIDQ